MGTSFFIDGIISPRPRVHQGVEGGRSPRFGADAMPPSGALPSYVNAHAPWAQRLNRGFSYAPWGGLWIFRENS